jgi:hypothetical protein
MPRARGLTGLVREKVACSGKAGRSGRWGRLGRIPKKIQTEIDFQISIDFQIWQEFEKFYKVIYKEFGLEDFS